MFMTPEKYSARHIYWFHVIKIIAVVILSAVVLFHLTFLERQKTWTDNRQKQVESMLIDFARLKAEKLEIVISGLAAHITNNTNFFWGDQIQPIGSPDFIYLPDGTALKVAESEQLTKVVKDYTSLSGGLLFSAYGLTSPDRDECRFMKTTSSNLSPDKICPLFISKAKNMNGWTIDKEDGTYYLTYRYSITDNITGYVKGYFWATFKADALFTSMTDTPYSISSRIDTLTLSTSEDISTTESQVNRVAVPINLRETLFINISLKTSGKSISTTLMFTGALVIISIFIVLAISYVSPITLPIERLLLLLKRDAITHRPNYEETLEERLIRESIADLKAIEKESFDLSVWVNNKARDNDWKPVTPHLRDIQKRVVKKEKEATHNKTNSDRLRIENKRYHSERHKFMAAFQALRSEFEIEMSHFLKDNVFNELHQLNFDLQAIDYSLTEAGDLVNSEKIQQAEGLVTNINDGVYKKIQKISGPQISSFGLVDKLSSYDATRYEMSGKNIRAFFSVEDYPYSERETHALNGLVSKSLELINRLSHEPELIDVSITHIVTKQNDGRHKNQFIIEAPQIAYSYDDNQDLNSEFEVEEIGSYPRSIDMSFSFTAHPHFRIVSIFTQTNFVDSLPEHA